MQQAVRAEAYRREMDPGHYDRQAEAQLKKVAAATKKRGELEKKAGDLDGKALRAEQAAKSTPSDSTRKSKHRDAARKCTDSAALRVKAGAASTAAAVAQGKADDFRRRAQEERDRRNQKDTRDAARRAREAERQAQREQRSRDALDTVVSRSIGDLRTRADDLEQRIAESRRQAPEQFTVLLMAGTTAGAKHALRLDQESREIDAKVRTGRYRDQIELQYTHATQVRDIVDALNRYAPGVVHFSGHGDAASLLFDGRDGKPQELHGDQLALLLQAAPKPIQMVVFNACLSARQAEAAVDFADFAIGMERPINDAAAKEFAGQFYGSLAAGATIDLAFRQAVAHATAVSGSPQGVGDPQLHVRPGASAEETVLVASDPGDADRDQGKRAA